MKLIGSRYVLLLIVSYFFNVVSASGQELPQSLVFSAIKGDYSQKVGPKMLKLAYGQLGIDVSIEYLPGKRALVNANHGLTDGEVARIADIELKYPHLVKVPTPLVEISGVAFTRGLKREINSWQDLQGLRVGIVNGVQFAENGTQGLDRVKVNSFKSLFNLLAKDRIDVAISVREVGLIVTEKHFPNRGIVITGKPVFQAPAYHYLHKKHANLIPLIDEVFQEMKKKGVFEKAYQKHFKDEYGR